jgi:hypothetical protein
MRPLISKNWKLVGLAGLAGVAATGVVIARDGRRRQALTPDEVRARLHQRYEAADPGPTTSAVAAVANAAPDTDEPHRLSVRRRRWRRLPPG